MREIILDTETTGLNHLNGDRLIEIGCIELVNRIPSGREFHRFVNPQRDVPAEAESVHGISTAFLRDKPLFADVAGEFLEFIAQDAIVIHNAAFDIGFLNFELGRLSLGAITMDRVTCTLQLAQAAASGRPEQSRCAVQALRHRQYQAHQARRARRLAAAGRGLHRAAGRSPGGLHRLRRRHQYADGRRAGAAAARHRCAASGAASRRGCRRSWKPRMPPSSKRWARRPSGAASSPPPTTLKLLPHRLAANLASSRQLVAGIHVGARVDCCRYAGSRGRAGMTTLAGFAG